MDFKLWTETMRKGEKLSFLPITTTVPESHKQDKKYLSVFFSTGGRQQPPGKGSAPTTSVKYKFIQLKHAQKCYLFLPVSV